MIDKDLEIQKINEYFLKEKKKLNKEIGEKLKEKRREKNISIMEIAEKTHISPTYVSQIEKGEYSVSLVKFIFFCNALDVNIGEILEDFVFKEKSNEELLYENLQKDKNISNNILEFMKEKQ